MKLTKLEWHNHPDFPAVKWTELELDAINKHAIAVAEAVKAECAKVCKNTRSNGDGVESWFDIIASKIASLEIEP